MTNAAAAVLRGWDLAAIALGFGLITGLGEGLSLFVYSKFGWNNWDKTLFNGSVEAIWTCPWIDVAVFGVLGLAAAAICRGGRRPRLTLAAVWVLATLMFFDWVNILGFGCMHTYAFLVLECVSGPNLAASREFAEKVKAKLQEISALRDVQFGQSLDYPTVDVVVDRQRAGLMGTKMTPSLMLAR